MPHSIPPLALRGRSDAARTGVAVSAIRFYEDKGLLQALRTGGNQRRFLRSDIRRVSFILIAQNYAMRLSERRALTPARTPLGETVSVEIQPAGAFATQRSAKMARMSRSHSGWPLARATSA